MELEMHNVSFLVICHLRAPGTIGVGSRKWINIKDLKTSPAHQGRCEGIVESYTLQENKMSLKLELVSCILCKTQLVGI